RSTDLASILSLEYRPVLSLESGAYVGIDASIRCASRAVAGVGPGEFLDIIDDAGLALPCFLWALRAACGAAREIRSVETLRDAWVLIPIAPRAVAHPMLLESTRATLRELDPPRGGICVALPEVAIADTRHDISATLRGLRAMGIGITLNDFG